MSVTKSFRMSDRTENMYHSLKEREFQGHSDTEIFSKGIEMLFETLSETHNYSFRADVGNFLKDDRQKRIFTLVCGLLELLSMSDGYYLEKEMVYYLTATQADIFYEGYDDLGKINVQQYRKIEEIMSNQDGITPIELQKFAEEMQRYYMQKK